MMGSRGSSFDWEGFAKGMVSRNLSGEWVLPMGITRIGNYAFYQAASSLNLSLVLPNTTTIIQSNAFSSCTSLVSITIPSSLTSIGTNAFSNCSRLERMIFEGSTPPALGNSTALGQTTYTFPIYVPDESVDTYKAATNWSGYASRIKPLSEWGVILDYQPFSGYSAERSAA